ncbi:Serine carboxypeptidase-like, partial [Thalictrum thalictroides]
CTEGLYDKNILEPKCLPIDIVRDRRFLGENSSREIRSPPLDPGLECRTTYGYMLSYYWANDDRVQTALNIRKGTVQEWISKRHYRSLIYSGDHDMIIPFIGTQEWIRSLNYSISDKWRPWLVNGHVAGYTRTYSNNMTYATVKGAGHIAPEYKPKECFAMFK